MKTEEDYNTFDGLNEYQGTTVICQNCGAVIFRTLERFFVFYHVCPNELLSNEQNDAVSDTIGMPIEPNAGNQK